MRYVFLVACLWLSAAPISAADLWPQFRGPTGQGIATATDLPLTWREADGPQAAENIVWKVAIPGRGWSSPVISDRQVWMTTATDGGRSLRAVCVDRGSGRITHDLEVFQPSEALPLNPKNSHASPTPVIQGEKLYVHFGSIGTACLDCNSGKILWTNNEYQADHKEGPGSSPVLHGDLLLLNCEGRDVRHVLALNKQDGSTAWHTLRSGELDPNPEYNKAYATPLVVGEGQDTLAVNPGAMRVAAYRPTTGEEVWRVRYNGFSNVPRPVAGDGLVYVCTGFARASLLAIRLGGQGDVTNSHVAWRVDSGVPRNSSPLLVGGLLYLVDDRGVASCLDAASGEVAWKQRLGGNYSASPLLADGRIYFCSEQGTTTIIAAGGEFNKMAENQLDGQVMASPAAVENALYLRTDTHLYRIEKR